MANKTIHELGTFDSDIRPINSKDSFIIYGEAQEATELQEAIAEVGTKKASIEDAIYTVISSEQIKNINKITPLQKTVDGYDLTHVDETTQEEVSIHYPGLKDKVLGYFTTEEEYHDGIIDILKQVSDNLGQFNEFATINEDDSSYLGDYPTCRTLNSFDLIPLDTTFIGTIYYVGTDSSAPVTTSNSWWWNVISISGGVASRVTQIAFSVYSNRYTIYIRTKHDDRWYGWNKIDLNYSYIPITQQIKSYHGTYTLTSGSSAEGTITVTLPTEYSTILSVIPKGFATNTGAMWENHIMFKNGQPNGNIGYKCHGLTASSTISGNVTVNYDVLYI